MRVVLKSGFIIVSLLIFSLLTDSLSKVYSQEDTYDWKSDWEIEEGLNISIDTEGYSFPTAIAFVPNPGSRPEDSLYFVTELEGKIKVVTNDRSVHTFADLNLDIPPFEQEAGMAGICLDPEHGYVFVTFASIGSDGILRNSIVRFDTQPETFALSPTDQVIIAPVLAQYQTAGSHQIGGCQVDQGLLYVSVADGGFRPLDSQDLNSILGKVIRMTLDGEPVQDNPFHRSDDQKDPANFIWAYGLRNPFGLKVVENTVFVADNGQALDRFIKVGKGRNYLWDGHDQSIASKADFVLTPSHGVVQLDHYPQALEIFPDQYRNSFYLALSGGSNPAAHPGVLIIDYDIEGGELLSVPHKFFQYVGEQTQFVTGLAFGPDGLYVVPILPNQAGVSAVLRITYDPAQQHPFRMSHSPPDGAFLMYLKGCTGCHMIEDTFFGASGPATGVKGPSLERKALISRLKERLHSEGYVQSLAEIDQLDSEPFVSYGDARREVLESKGMDRVRTWIKYRVQEPRFDNTYSLMPNLGVIEEEAALITDALLGTGGGISDKLKNLLLPSNPSRRHVALYFLIGGVIGGIAAGSFSFLATFWFYRVREK